MNQLFARVRRKLLRSTIRMFPSNPGSELWFMARELHYGGYETGIRVRTESPFAPPGRPELGHTGGDRMLDHGYAKHYAEALRSYCEVRPPKVIAEVGILKGTGLAIWCDLFPGARVIGFDIELGYFEDNRRFLEWRGAFRENSPELYRLDQFVDNSALLNEILGDDKVDVVIDDGHHSLESIESTMRSFSGFLAPRFVYFVEDYEESTAGLAPVIGADCHEQHGELSVFTGGRR